MSQYVDTGCKTFVADAAVAKYARVIFEDDGKVVTAGLTEMGVGIAMNEANAAGEAIEVKLWNSQGTFPMIAIEAAAVGATVYTEAAGKVQDTAQGTAYPIGQIVDTVAPTADGDIVEVALGHYAGLVAT